MSQTTGQAATGLRQDTSRHGETRRQVRTCVKQYRQPPGNASSWARNGAPLRATPKPRTGSEQGTRHQPPASPLSLRDCAPKPRSATVRSVGGGCHPL